MALEICGMQEGGREEPLPGWSQLNVTPFHVAAYFGREEIVRMIIERRGKEEEEWPHTINTAEFFDPVHFAIVGQQPSMVRLVTFSFSLSIVIGC